MAQAFKVKMQFWHWPGGQTRQNICFLEIVAGTSISTEAHGRHLTQAPILPREVSHRIVLTAVLGSEKCSEFERKAGPLA